MSHDATGNNLPMATAQTTQASKTRQEKETELLKRIQTMQDARRLYGIESKWIYAEKVMVPHQFVDTGLRKWQSKNAKMVAFSKVHTALSMVIDQNPEAQIFARSKENEKKANLFKGLYSYSWDHGDGKIELKKFAYDCGKYGFAVGRTYHRRDEREIQDLKIYDPETNDNFYEKRTLVDFDDVYWENMNIWECWFDEQADSKKNMRDWGWRKVMSFETFKLKFTKDKFENIDEVKPGGDTSEKKFTQGNANSTPEGQSRFQIGGEEMIEVYFYENKEFDKFQVIANGTLILDIPLPYKHKQLSCFFATWWQRATDTIYGVGIPELCQNNTELLNKIVNMRVDQLTISIYSMLLYGGSEEFSEEELELEPGRAKKVFDVNNYKWLEIPGAGAESYKEEEYILNDIDEESGITKSLGGREIGRTATEISFNREAGLRRMKTPLDSIEDAMEEEGNLRLALIQQVYSNPVRVEKIIGREGMEDYVNYYRQVRMPFEKQENGEIAMTDKDQFFTVEPEDLLGEYDVKIRPMSTLPISEELERQRKLQLFNIIARAPYTDVYKAEAEIVKAFGEEPDDWLMSEEQIIGQQQQAQQNQIAQAQQEQMMAEQEQMKNQPEMESAPSVIPQSEAQPDLSAMMGAQGLTA